MMHADLQGLGDALAAVFDDPSSPLCDCVFSLRDGTGAEASRVRAMSAVAAARSPGLKVLLAGDLRVGWLGARRSTTCANGSDEGGLWETLVELPPPAFSVAGKDTSGADSVASEAHTQTLVDIGPPWGAEAFSRVLRYLQDLHSGGIELPMGRETVAILLCADHLSIVPLRDTCAAFIRSGARGAAHGVCVASLYQFCTLRCA